MKDYIKSMLEQFPLVRETEEDKKDYTLDNIVGLDSEKSVPYEYHINYNLPYKIKQFNVNGCGACTTAAACMIQKNINVALSWMFLYAYRKDTDYRGQGTKLRETLSNARDFGIAPLELFNKIEEYPQIREDLESMDLDKILAAAEKYKITGYAKISKEEVKSMLSQGYPVFISVKIYDSFYTAPSKNYIIPSTSAGTYHGCHEMLAIGYKGDTLELLNWWGSNSQWDNNLFIDLNSDSINDLYIIVDLPVIKEPVKSGWKKEDNTWYYYKDGNKYKGWLEENNKWFYLDAKDYHMATGWFQDDSTNNNWYYAYKSTEAKDGKQVYEGEMATGWIKLGDYWYYLEENSNGYKGKCYINCTASIGEKEYSFDDKGHWIEEQPIEGLSTKGAEFIKSWEGYSSVWYDAGDGYDTIGYGTATSGKVGQRLKSQGITSCTESQATGWLKEEINNMAAPITEKLNAARITLKQCQFDALASFAYNCGTASLFSSTLWKYVISNRSAADIQSAFLMWNKCNGRALEGLTKRRQAEANMYNYGVYDSNH